MSKAIIKITKGEIEKAIENNFNGVAFRNKGAQARFNKNKKIIERREQLKTNAKHMQQKAIVKHKETIALPVVDEKHTTDLTGHTDEELLKAIKMLGITVVDMIDGGVDATRALRLYSDHNREQNEKAISESVARSVHIPQKS